LKEPKLKGDSAELTGPIYESVDVDIQCKLIQQYSRGVEDEHHNKLESAKGDYVLPQGFEAENVKN
jgi:hypothetical protein